MSATVLGEQLKAATDVLKQLTAFSMMNIQATLGDNKKVSDEDRHDDTLTAIEILSPAVSEMERNLMEYREVLAAWNDIIRRGAAAQKTALEADLEKLLTTEDARATVYAATAKLQKMKESLAALNGQARRLARLVKATVAAPPARTTPPKATSIKLPQQKLPVYDGTDDTTTWDEFWAQFQVAIDQNKELSASQKHVYLKGQLQGTAADTIIGLPLDGSEYTAAVDLLRKRFDNKDKRIRELHQQLIALKPCNSITEANAFALRMEKIARQLENMKENIESAAIYQALEAKLPKALIRRIAKERRETAVWNTTTFRLKLREAIDEELEIDEVYEHAHEKSDRSKKGKQSNDSTGEVTPTILATTKGSDNPQKKKEGGRGKCCFCKGNTHNSEDCKKFATIDERFRQADDQKICRRCTSPGHGPRECKIEVKCEKCKVNNHLTAFCYKHTPMGNYRPFNQHQRQFGQRRFEQHNKRQSTNTNGTNSNANWTPLGTGATQQPDGRKILPITNCATTTHQGGKRTTYILLLSAQVKVSNPDEPHRHRTLTAIVDRFSQAELISVEVAKELGLSTKRREQLHLQGIGAEANKYASRCVKLTLQTNDGTLEMEANTIPAGHLPHIVTVPIEDDEVGDLDEILLDNHQIKRADLLIGTRLYHQLRIREKRVLPSGFVLSNSRIGSMIDGEGQLRIVPATNLAVLRKPMPERMPRNCLTITLRADIESNDEQDLEDLATKFFATEMGSDGPEITASEMDKVIHEQFKRDLRMVDGRYECAIPFKQEAFTTLPTNYILARARLRSTLKKLREKPELMKKYDQIIREQAGEGIIELAPAIPEGLLHYLPHQPIVKAGSEKLRIVFDASAKANKTAPSLNTVVHQGPTLLNSLAGMLIRFRLYPIAIAADIKGAFLQLSLRKDSRDCTRFLWPQRPTDDKSPIQIWRFKRVTFGVNASPFLLAATIEEHLKRNGSEFADRIKDNIYVDNSIGGVNKSADTLQYCNELIDLFAYASMSMREFVSNDRESIKQLPEERQLKADRTKVLGMTWNTVDDTILLPGPPDTDSTLTKRAILKQIAKPFDPLGLLSPMLLPAKRFLQRIWKRPWDEKLTDEEVGCWKSFTNSWTEAREIPIPRRYFNWDPEDTVFQLHTFCDASASGKGFCIYLRAEKRDEVAVSLVYARSQTIKINEEKQLNQTIPKLELAALDSGGRATDFVIKELQLDLNHVQVWSDSEIAVKWITGNNESKEVFVRNRVKRLQKWNVKHIAGIENPADLCSRSMLWSRPKEVWWNGPEWLKHKQQEWPVPKVEHDPAVTKLTPAKTTTFYAMAGATTKEKSTERTPMFGKTTLCTSFDSRKSPPHKTTWRKVKGINAYILRFITNRVLRHWNGYNEFAERAKAIFLAHESRALTAEELAEAETIIIRESQELFIDNNASKFLRLTQDSNGVRHCPTRLQNAEIEEESKWPIFIPKEAPIAKYIAEDAHWESGHLEGRITVTNIRKRYWISSAGRLAQRVYCFKCSRDQAKPYSKPMPPPLPSNRVTRCAPWSKVGVDHFGPLTTCEGKEHNEKKHWAVLFTCQVCRAIHIELAEDYSAEAFIDALRRFCAQRRTPDEFFSDNALNYVAANDALQRLWQNRLRDPFVLDFAATKGIKWSFNCPAAPWRNGFTERMIGPVKKAMRRSLGKWRLRQLQLSTILYEIAAIVNERPLTALPTRPGRVLRPVDLIRYDWEGVCGLPDFDASEPDDTEFKPASEQRMAVTLINNLGVVKSKLDSFWAEWNSAYLLGLTEDHLKRKSDKTQLWPRAGDLVLVSEENQKRGCWSTGRIVRLVGPRTAEIKLAKTTITRATNLLHPMELPEPVQDFNSVAAEKREHGQEVTTPQAKDREPEKPPEMPTPPPFRWSKWPRKAKEGNKRYTAATTKVTGSLLLCTLIMTWLGGASGKTSTTASWCRSGEGSLIRIPTHHSCPPFVKGLSIWRKVTWDIFEPDESPIPIKATLCTRRLDETTYYDNILGDRFHRNTSTNLAVTTDECSLMIHHKRCLDGDLLPTGGGGFGTRRNLEMPDTSLWEKVRKYTKYANVSNCYTHEITIYADRKSLEVTVPGHVRQRNCRTTDNACELEKKEIVIWDHQISANATTCRLQLFKERWNGEVSIQEGVWISAERDFALSFPSLIKPKVTKDCIGNMICAQQGFCVPFQQVKEADKQQAYPIYKRLVTSAPPTTTTRTPWTATKVLIPQQTTPRNTPAQRLVWKTTPQVTYEVVTLPQTRKKRDFESEAEGNSHLFAEEYSLVTAMNRTIQILHTSECTRRQREIMALPDLFRNNPTGAAKQILNRTNVQARWVSSRLLEVQDCVPVPVQNLTWRPSGDDCYTYLPVDTILLGKPWRGFLDTRSMILSSTASKGPCEIYSVHYIDLGEAILAVNQRTGNVARRVPPINDWHPETPYSDFPKLQMITFHTEAHNPHHMPVADHAEEILRQTAKEQQDEDHVMSKRVERTESSSGPSWNLIESAENKALDFMARLRWHWLNLVAVAVTIDFGLLALALMLDSLMKKLRAIGFMTAAIQNGEADEGAERPARRRQRPTRAWRNARKARARAEAEESDEMEMDELLPAREAEPQHSRGKVPENAPIWQPRTSSQDTNRRSRRAGVSREEHPV